VEFGGGKRLEAASTLLLMGHRQTKASLVTPCEYIGILQEIVDPDTLASISSKARPRAAEAVGTIAST
jgi:hypothetical protein